MKNADVLTYVLIVTRKTETYEETAGKFLGGPLVS